MLLRYAALSFFFASIVAGAGKKNVASGRGENEDVILKATLYADAAAVKEALGDDLGGHFIVVQVTVEPKYTKEITIDRDDFVLRTDKDGDRTKPLAPSQIAGRGSLVLTHTEGPAGNGAQRSRGWSLGGIGMGGGGMSPGVPADQGETKAKMETSDSENPLKKVLDEKVLPEKKIEAPTTGFLYFPMEGQKMKDLEMVYGPKESQIRIRFK
jgi:hypothetical protein